MMGEANYTNEMTQRAMFIAPISSILFVQLQQFVRPARRGVQNIGVVNSCLAKLAKHSRLSRLSLHFWASGLLAGSQQVA
jgi:hypothetical protein